MGALLSPVLRFYQLLLYPVAKPSAWALDKWLCEEDIEYFRERRLRGVIRKHIESEESDISRIEGIGALNFLALDDTRVRREGEPIHQSSIMCLPLQNGSPVFS